MSDEVAEYIKATQDGAHARIWLQVCGLDEEDIDPIYGFSPGEVTWCQDQIYDTDVEYVRADIAERLRARVTELEAENAELQAQLDAIHEGRAM